MLREFINNTNGSTIIEYALIAFLVSTVIIAGVTGVGSETGNIYNDVNEQVGGSR